MRFALSPNDRRVQDLVVALDRDDVPFAETWRAVGDAASQLGLLRPGYHLVRELAKAARVLRAARADTRRAMRRALMAVGSPYAYNLRRSARQLVDAYEHEVLVLEQHKAFRGEEVARGP